jgi:murein DD-endopeptidase MepM/ murein hydrolase activator NlpD
MSKDNRWPLQRLNIKIPLAGPGSFWENRGDRHHCGVDLYTPQGENVINIESGVVVDIGLATHRWKNSYWNNTYYVIVGCDSLKWLVKYSELENVRVNKDQRVSPGDVLADVGQVLNFEKIDEYSPLYIQRLKEKGNSSMLHLELLLKLPEKNKNYRGGNWFGAGKPDWIINPTTYLLELKKIFWDDD